MLHILPQCPWCPAPYILPWLLMNHICQSAAPSAFLFSPSRPRTGVAGWCYDLNLINSLIEWRWWRTFGGCYVLPQGFASSVSQGRVLGFERSEPLSRAREFSGIWGVKILQCLNHDAPPWVAYRLGLRIQLPFSRPCFIISCWAWS